MFTDFLIFDVFNVLVFETGEVDSLSQAMASLWQCDALAAEMGLNAGSRFAENFSSKQYTTALEKVYRQATQ